MPLSHASPEKRRVLILCTGNSCRSQMAEALINHDLGAQWQARSAGTKPAGFVHPLALAALNELGINVQGQRSEHVDRYRQDEFDVVITVCDDAAEQCPAWLGPGKTVHIPFPDPAQAAGSEAERLAAFRGVRDDIRREVATHLTRIQSPMEDNG